MNKSIKLYTSECTGALFLLGFAVGSFVTGGLLTVALLILF
jgi:hypothetical protein